MLTILHLLNSRKFSGAENVVINIIKLNRDKRMIYASPDGDIRKKLEFEKIEYCALEDSSAAAVKKAIQTCQPDIIHAHDFTMSCYAARVCGRIPVISHLHNNPLWIKKMYDPRSIAYALAQIHIRRLIVVSDAVLEEYSYRFLIKKTSVIGNIVDADHVRKLAMEDKQEPRERGVSEKEGKNYDIAFLGRFSPPKNPLYFCSVVKHLKTSKPDIRAIMIGDGELMEEAKQYIEGNNLSGNITLLGFQDNPYRSLKRAKILLMPSVWEGFGLAAVEGMILGKPVVCSGVGGLADIVDETCGRIAKSGKDYVTEIRKLLEDDAYYDRKSRVAMERAKRFCDKEQYRDRINSVYQSVLGK